MSNKIYIVGAGTYGQAMCELAELTGYEVLGFYDDDDDLVNTYAMGKRVIGKFSNLGDNEIESNNFIVGIGDNNVRYKIMSKINELGGSTPTIIHPNATVSPSAEIGKGVYIQANAYIWTKAKIGDFSIISPNVVVCHHTTLGKACHISNVSGVGASITIEDRVFVGMGSTIVTGLKVIGENTIIGAGAVVLKDLPANCTAVGVPAKPIKFHNKA